MANPDSFEYIVVGAGSAGCVVASRLSRRATVLLLEAGGRAVEGGDGVASVIADPDKVVFAQWDEHIVKRYQTVAQPGLGGRRIIQNRGVVLGGSSAVNGMIYVRGNRRDYDTWAQLGNEGWSFTEVLPAFKKSEGFDPAPLTYGAEDQSHHGRGGPLSVRSLPGPSAAAEAFIAAAAELGYGGGDSPWDFNGRQQEGGAGLYQVTLTAGGRRASTAAAFLEGLASPERLTVATGASVSSLLIDNGRAVGVQCVQAGQPRTYRAEREVILSAGALESPKILMLSGIGPADDLRAKGLTVRVDLPGVGQNLQDHLMILIYHPTRRDPGQSRFTAEAGLFLNTRDQSGAVSPDLQFHFLARMPQPPPWLAAVLQLPPQYFVVCPTLCKPHSRGRVSLRSDLPADDVLIQPNYLQCAADAEVLARGIELTRELTHARGLCDLADDAQVPFGISGATFARLSLPAGRGSALSEFIAATSTTVWHPAGTCGMGRGRDAVVDPQLRLHGVEGLRVADASVIPTVPAGNINAACIMIGERCAELAGA